MHRILKLFQLAALTAASTLALPAAVVEYNLTIAQESVNFTGKSVNGMTINGGIPGPTLRFTEGDLARIHVRNTMSAPASIHWHGLIVPNRMDGVPFVTFPPIEPGATFTYEFPLVQSGTYWYHSHSSLQEQSGVYGSIAIEPADGDPRFPDVRDHIVLLSDWTDENPHEVMRTLRSGNEFYGVHKRSGQSIVGAYRSGHLKDYFVRELQRMPAMDLADVAYDRFLLNGQTDERLSAQPGERLRLRLIDGSASTFFHVEFAGGPMTLIAADGQDVEPVEVDRLLIGIAETYDVLVTVPADGSFEFRATSHDRSGRASLWIGEGQEHPAPLVPAPNLYQTMGGLNWKRVFAATPARVMGMSDERVNAGDFDRPGMAMGDMKMSGMAGSDTSTGSMNMPGMDHSKMKVGSDEMTPVAPAMKTDHSSMSGMDHSKMDMPPAPSTREGMAMVATKSGQAMPVIVAPPPIFEWMDSDISSLAPLARDGSVERPWGPYAKLRATHPTTLDSAKPTRDIRLTLDGDMERYVWFINNEPLSIGDSIHIKEGEVVRFIMINRTMMHHPMHLHGHFFRVINGQGDYSPLKHTIDVEPMSTTVIEFDANEKGDWFFHCHLLYHMHAGMARVVEYDGFDPDPATQAVRSKLFEDPFFLFGRAAVTTNMTEGWLEYSNSRNCLGASWEAGWGTISDVEWEGIATYGRYLNRFTTVFAGADLLGADRSLVTTRGVLGVAYTLPFNLYSRSWIDTDGGLRAAVRREFMLTPRIALEFEAQYDTHSRWEGVTALDYVLSKHAALQVRWHSEFKWGAGLQFIF